MAELHVLTHMLDDEQIRWKANEPLREHCTFRIGGNASVFVMPDTNEKLCKAISLCRKSEVRYYLLGNGSNVLFSDNGYTGAVIDVSAVENRLEIRTDGTVRASAGVMLSRVCLAALEAGLTGLEFAYGIPGTVGGAVYMNAGAYGGEVVDVLQSVEVLNHSGEIEQRPASMLELGYRRSMFERTGECILSATFALRPGVPEEIRARMEDLMGRRKDKQPLDKPNAGSTFKRPAGAFAGALIDQCGLRGYRVGDAAISEKHCGFVVNLGQATCAQVLELCDQVSGIVKEMTGYQLEKEIRVIE